LFLSDKIFMDKDTIIKQQATEIQLLKETIIRLEEKIAQLEKNSGNSSKSPSSDIVKPTQVIHKFVRKRKHGGQYGHRKFTRQPFKPEQVDETIEYEFHHTEAKGLKPLNEWFIIQQVVLPEKMVKVIEHKARKYLDPVTGKISIAPMPNDIRQGGLLGADATAFVAFMKGRCHMSYATIQSFFKDLMKLDISRGMLCKAVQKTSKALKPSYDRLADRLPAELRVNVDETGHHDEGILHWTWCFDTRDYSVFTIDKSRGYTVLEICPFV
jgi:transposase